MSEATQVRAEPAGDQGGGARYPARSVPAAVEAELRAQYETAVAFADFCVFLGAGRGVDRAAQLVEAAQQLYDETLDALRGDGRPL